MQATTSALVCLLAGISGGIASSAPIGPINLWVADTTLHGRDRTLPGFLAGVILCDVVYAAFAAWGYHALAQDARTTGLLSLVAGCVLIGLGIVMTARAGAPRFPPVGGFIRTHPARHFLLGAAMMGSNPAFLMFWVFVVDLVAQRTDVVIESGTIALFLAGVIIGDGLWFAFLTRCVRSGSGRLGSLAMRRLQRVLVLGFVAAGVYAVMRGLTPMS